MNAQRLNFIVEENTQHILTTVKDLEPIDTPAKALAVVAYTIACDPYIVVDAVFNELLTHEGFKVLLSLLDYRTNPSELEPIAPEVVESFAEPFIHSEMSRSRTNGNIADICDLIDYIADILKNNKEIPRVFKFENFGFNFLYFMALDQYKINTRTILTDSKHFKFFVLYYSDNMLEEMKKYNGKHSETVWRVLERCYRKSFFKDVHSWENHDALSAAVSIFEDAGYGLKYADEVQELLNFIVWHAENSFEFSYCFEVVKQNVQYCKHVAESIFKNEFPAVLKALQKGETSPEYLGIDYLNDEFLKYYWETIAEEGFFIEEQQADLNKYSEELTYEKFANIFDFDDIEIYDKDDLNNTLKNFELIYKTFENLVLNFAFDESNENTWGTNGLISVIKFGFSVGHYFDLLEKFKIDFELLSKYLLSEFEILYLIQIYLNTHVKGFSIKNEMRDFLDSLKTVLLTNIKENFSKVEEHKSEGLVYSTADVADLIDVDFSSLLSELNDSDE